MLFGRLRLPSQGKRSRGMFSGRDAHANAVKRIFKLQTASSTLEVHHALMLV